MERDIVYFVVLYLSFDIFVLIRFWQMAKAKRMLFSPLGKEFQGIPCHHLFGRTNFLRGKDSLQVGKGILNNV